MIPTRNEGQAPSPEAIQYALKLAQLMGVQILSPR